MANVYIKTKILSGDSAIKYLKEIRSKTIFIVCDKFISESGTIKYITNALDLTNSVEVFDRAIPDPTTEVVGKGLNMIYKVKPDIVIGFGGGSAIDTAKGIIYFANLKKGIKKPEFITVPTTSGTGSEVTSVAVITDLENKSKHLIASDEILADVALVDPQLTLSVPQSITANTGMDVFTHALEAYVSKDANVFSDALAEKSIELLLNSLLTCYKEGKNLVARTMMHEASTLAGIAFNTAGLGVNHSIAHQLGGTFHIPHGLANAILLNEVIEYNCVNHDIMLKYASLAYKVQLVSIDETPEFAVKVLKEIINTLMRCMNMPLNIRGIGIDIEEYKHHIQRMSDTALLDNCLNTTPRKIGAAGIQKILCSIY
ncbi:1-propanol dehydrogenase PduQ [Clostridium cadaveris]|uniref:1-propanol dehydrogenase PduQ n=1 Tax=Clostridium cadaveris TaxID=1529 RepID=UPI00041C1560|nr:1-propanol dehydrogenase PduQ [Clostridium cadaveris]NME63367.1 iron-containing alcohol dehydrogenase [Clostridium cadaveris]